MLVNTLTNERLEALAVRPPHGLIICGAVGSGKETLALEFAKKAFQTTAIKTVEPVDNKSIGIEIIRDASRFLTVKSTQEASGRILLVLGADQMTEEAQNALLKTLEEPASGSSLVLVVTDLDQILPTIRSRVAQLDVLPIDWEQAKAGFKDIDETELKKNFTLSEGAAELLEALISDPGHPLRQDIDLAKQYLQKSAFERLAMTDDIKDKTANMLKALLKISKSALRNSAVTPSQRARWIKIYEVSAQALLQSNAYVSKKTVLLNLALKIG